MGAVAVRTLPFGELALLEDLITREQLHSTLSYQAERRDAAKPDRKLGTLLVHQGYMTRDEARAILRIQRDRGPIDGYVLVERLGAGGMGTVFRAIQKSLEREVALKILTPRASRHDRYRARFLQEAKFLAQLKHPNLVRAFEVGECQHHLYFAMEFVRGRTARDLIARYGYVPEPQSLDFMEQIAGAMAHYGEQRILHRDIKPENILISETGEAKLADLGLSKRLDEECHITRPGKTLGTPLYISPELARGDENLDIRSDLYSFGATFYHMACGVPPFEALSSGDLLTAHVREIPREPRTVNPILTEAFSDLLMRLLEKKPEKRFETPEALVEAIRKVRAGEHFEPKEEEEESAPRALRRLQSSSGERPGARRDGAPAGSVSGSRFRAARRGSTADAPALGSRASAGRAFPAIGSGSARRTSDSRSATLAAVVLALAALVGAAFAFQGDTQRAGGRTSDQDDVRAHAASDPEAALAEAATFERAHAGEPDLVIAHYDAIASVVPGAAEARERFLRHREDAAASAFDELKLDVRDCVEQGRRDDALRRIDGFAWQWRATRAWTQCQDLRRDVVAGKGPS